MAYLRDDAPIPDLYDDPLRDQFEIDHDPWSTWTAQEREDFVVRVSPPFDPTDRAIFIQPDEVPF